MNAMNMTNKPIHFLTLLALAAALFALPACKKSSEIKAPPAPIVSEAETDSETDSDQLDPPPDAQAEPGDEVELIEQGGGGLTQPAEFDLPTSAGDDEEETPIGPGGEPLDVGETDHPADHPAGPNEDAEVPADEETQEPQTPLTDLPGFTPLPPKEGTPAVTDPTHAAQVAPDAPVMLHVTAFSLLKQDTDSLAPLREFFEREESDTLDEDEVLAFFEMVQSLTRQGVMRKMSSPRVLVNAGQSGSLVLMALQRVAVGEKDVALPRDQLMLKLAPAIERADGDSTLVKVDYALQVPRQNAPFKVHADGLALDIGPRTRVAGTGVVPSGQSFYFVRRVIGPINEHELLFFVRPQVLAAEFNK